MGDFIGTPTKSGYTFTGWSNGSSSLSGNVDPNPENLNELTLTAEWTLSQTVWNFDYTGSVQAFTAPVAGYYKLEVWGAQGGATSTGKELGGYGGYAYGIIRLNATSNLYVTVGGKGGSPAQGERQRVAGGYNGGGATSTGGCSASTTTSGGSGGGFSDISTIENEVKYYSDYGYYIKSSTDGILVLAGGGGGSSFNRDVMGGAGGGYRGGNGYDTACNSKAGESSTTGGTQSAGGFGGHQISTYPEANYYVATQLLGGGFYTTSTETGGCHANSGGGGGGWYGGGVGKCAGGSGGGGSGHVDTSKLISYQMYCFAPSNNYSPASFTNEYGYCYTSNSQYTYGTTSTGHAVSNTANTGNGFAKITYLGTSI